MQFVLCVCFCVVLAAGQAFGHLCLISPPQRGSISGLNKQGSPDCILLKSPCGGRSGPRTPDMFLQAGKNISVTFQKNLDHWDKSNPGYFSISVGELSSTISFKELARIPDMGEPSLHLYTTQIMLPQETGPGFVMQVVYVTNNSKAPPAFYQCADFALIKM